MTHSSSKVITVVLKGYPRLSETFIAQELLALQNRGFNLHFISLRHPTDKKTHPIHDEITAPVNYLPEYLHDEPARVYYAWKKARKFKGYDKAFAVWQQDLKRDTTRNRVRRFGQAMVLAAELPENTAEIYAHFLHTPASVARYAAMIRDIPWSCSAHAKDIYTSPDWELSEKLNDVSWLVTCTAFNVAHLKKLATDPKKVSLLYHGLDLDRFPTISDKKHTRNGSDVSDPVRIVSVGRAVIKKGYDDLLNAFAKLPKDLNWQFEHIGGGPLLSELKSQAEDLGLSDRIVWHGAQSQKFVLDHLKAADIFTLASRIADDGDRDGLPNVLMEAQSQKAAALSTAVSAIPELIENEKTGLLVRERDPDALAKEMLRLISAPELRQELSEAGDQKLRSQFGADLWFEKLAAQFEKDLA